MNIPRIVDAIGYIDDDLITAVTGRSAEEKA